MQCNLRYMECPSTEQNATCSHFAGSTTDRPYTLFKKIAKWADNITQRILNNSITIMNCRTKLSCSVGGTVYHPHTYTVYIGIAGIALC